MKNYAGISPVKQYCKKCGVELVYVNKGGYCEKHKHLYKSE